MTDTENVKIPKIAFCV